MFSGRRVELNWLSVAKVPFIYLSRCDAWEATNQRNNDPVAIDRRIRLLPAFTPLRRENYHALNAQKQEMKSQAAGARFSFVQGQETLRVGVAEKKAINRIGQCNKGENRWP